MLLKQKKLATKQANAISQNRNLILDQVFGQLNTRYRRAQNVKYFDEIIEEWNRQ